MSDGAKKTIFEGCVQVDSFGPDDEYEDGTEEDHYVTLDLGAVDPTMFTMGSPPEVMEHVRGVLEGMGIVVVSSRTTSRSSAYVPGGSAEVREGTMARRS